MAELAPLTVVGSESEAEMLAGLLASDGIDCSWRITNTGAGALGQTTLGGPVEILVRPADLERARALLGAPDQD